jgi:AcrR family transcriptional regulator
MSVGIRRTAPEVIGMGQRSDAKAKMVTAARQLIRERGYHATAMSDVVALSAAPRGSVYFHFPRGKTQLAVEAVEAHARDQAEQIKLAGERSRSVADLVNAYVGRARENLVQADYSEGCTIAPLVLEGGPESDELAETSRAALSVLVNSLATEFVGLGLARPRAAKLAEVVVSGVEGALVTGRAFRSAAPFDTMLAALQDHVAQLGLAGREKPSRSPRSPNHTTTKGKSA